ncbi:hypothetical protein [Dysgonomonas sp. 25]|uniref:hypothetical protein n=1 Tax=Dysgonomonas sp. 25 TaxID=2302933 RepID=UPI0013D4B303|nr:hypothetical protein [Dysgonomonas sp. 25]NDV67922.1 hypothetical protein [Dysgonomonas sp. 25]
MKLKKLKLLDAEILSDTEMKNVFGGYAGGSYGGSYSGIATCSITVSCAGGSLGCSGTDCKFITSTINGQTHNTGVHCTDNRDNTEFKQTCAGARL